MDMKELVLHSLNSETRMENARIWLLVMEAYTRVHVMMTRGGPWTDVWVPWEALRIPSSLHSTDGPCSPPGSSLLQKAITSKRAYFMPSSILQSLAPQLPWPIPVWVILRLWIHLQSALNSSSTLDFRIRFFHVQEASQTPSLHPFSEHMETGHILCSKRGRLFL